MKSYKTIILLLSTTILYAYSESREDAAEPGSIRAMTEEIGHEAAQMIQAPMDEAHFSVDQENARIRDIEKRLNETE